MPRSFFPSHKNFQKACELLSNGQLVVIPTETVYGLAADATQNHAVAKIYTLKDRPQFNPLIIHVPSLESALPYAVFTPLAFAVAEAFWQEQQAPFRSLTLVLKQKDRSPIADLVTAGLSTIAVRVPHHPVALDLLKAYGKPLAAPSANRSTQISPTTSAAVINSFGEHTPFLLEGGACTVGLESTILDISDEEHPVLLRPGSAIRADLEAVLKKPIQLHEGSSIKAPGMMRRHYAPSLPVRLNAITPQAGEAFLAFGLCDACTLNLSKTGDLQEAATNLFSYLRKLDDSDLYSGIAVMPIPEIGIGVAINDRLKRAATREG